MFDNGFAVSFIETSGIFEFVNQELYSVFGMNRWFTDDYVHIYIRNQYKYMPVVESIPVVQYKKKSAICVASISVPESYQHQGLDSTLINVIHESHNKELTFVELAHNKYLRAWLIREGWTRYDKYNPTYYKVKPQIDNDDTEEE